MDGRIRRTVRFTFSHRLTLSTFTCVSRPHLRELWVAKGVLQFASKSSLRDANALLDAFQVRDRPTLEERRKGSHDVPSSYIASFSSYKKGGGRVALQLLPRIEEHSMISNRSQESVTCGA